MSIDDTDPVPAMTETITPEKAWELYQNIGKVAGSINDSFPIDTFPNGNLFFPANEADNVLLFMTGPDGIRYLASAEDGTSMRYATLLAECATLLITLESGINILAYERPHESHEWQIATEEHAPFNTPIHVEHIKRRPGVYIRLLERLQLLQEFIAKGNFTFEPNE